MACEERNGSLFIKGAKRRVKNGRDWKRGLQEEQKTRTKFLSDHLALGTLQTFLSMKQGLIQRETICESDPAKKEDKKLKENIPRRIPKQSYTLLSSLASKDLEGCDFAEDSTVFQIKRQ